MSVLLTILWVLLWILLTVLGLLLLLLALPVDSRLVAERYTATRARLRVRYCWGLLSGRARLDAEVQELELRILGFRIWRRGIIELIARARRDTPEAQEKKRLKQERKRQKQEQKRQKQAQKRQKQPAKDEAESGWRGIPPHLPWALGRALWALKVRGEIVGVYGFDDPSTTGMVEGLRAGLGTAVPALALDELEADFTREVLRGHTRLSFQVWIPRLAVAAAGFFIDRRGRELVRYFRKSSPAKNKPAHAFAA